MSLLTLPDYGGNWRSRAFVYRTAKTTNGRTFIEPFDLYKTFDSEFIAVGISVANSRENWRNGGYLAQEIRFVTGTNYAINNKAFYRLPDLLIDNVSIIRVNKLAEAYRLRYFPPNYFTDVLLRVWEYVGSTNEITNDIVKLTTLTAELNLRFDALTQTLTTDLTAITSNIAKIANSLDVELETQNLYTVRINIGGEDYTDTEGNLWLGRQLAEYEGTYRTHDPIVDPNSVLYESSLNIQTAGYSDPNAPSGEYQISFYAQEWYYDQANIRFIDIYINGVLVEQGLDIWTEAGGTNKPLVKTYNVTLTGGIDILATEPNGKIIICALEILQVKR